MRRAVIWISLGLIGFIFAAFFISIRPLFVEMKIRREAKEIAEIVASEIGFMSKMREQGAIAGQRIVEIEFEGEKMAEIMVHSATQIVNVRIVAGRIAVNASAPYYAIVPVEAPTKVYDGEVRFALYYSDEISSFVINVANIVGGG